MGLFTQTRALAALLIRHGSKNYRRATGLMLFFGCPHNKKAGVIVPRLNQ